MWFAAENALVGEQRIAKKRQAKEFGALGWIGIKASSGVKAVVANDLRLHEANHAGGYITRIAGTVAGRCRNSFRTSPPRMGPDGDERILRTSTDLM